MTRPSRWFSTARARWVRALRTVWTKAWGTSGLTSRPSRCADAAKRAVERRQAGEQQDRRVGVLFLEPPGQLHPGVIGELVVDHDRGGTLQSVQRECLGGVRCHEHLDARALEHRRETVPGGLVVVDDKDRVL